MPCNRLAANRERASTVAATAESCALAHVRRYRRFRIALFGIVDRSQDFEKRSPEPASITLTSRCSMEYRQRISDGHWVVWYVGTGRLRFNRFRLVSTTRQRPRGRGSRRCDPLALTCARQIAGIRVLSSELAKFS